MRPGLYVHALRSARPRQLRARALRPLARRRFPAGQAPALVPASGAVDLWRSAAFDSAVLAGTGSERLRAFHAQYGEEVLTVAREGDAARARVAMENWIGRHPPKPGDAWHPYPLATRVGNWLASLALVPESETGAIRESLWRQLLHLERNVEDDILGNHVIRNARALLLGGAAFDSARLLEAGGELLARELPEQVLPDGGHYERSPVYHLVVLRDLLEVEAAVPGSVPLELLERMRRFAAALSRPDGEPALFNDGTLDLAPRLDLPAPPEGLAVFADTGYAVWRQGNVWLAFDCGPPAPPYLPAHAHADALSFQLWVDGNPVVVDPGMLTYEPGSERDWFRGTRAHSTVAVDGRDQFELWGAFRSGRLPKVELLEAAPHVLVASVEWPGGCRHIRRITLDGRTLRIDDTIEGRGYRLLENSLQLAGPAAVEIAGRGLPVTTELRPVSERLYQRFDRPALALRGNVDLPARLGWTITLPVAATIAP